MTIHEFGSGWYQRQLEPVDQEIARLANICGIALLDPGVVERVVNGDTVVCSKPNPLAFEKLRGLIKMHYMLKCESVLALGPEKSQEMLETIREGLRDRYRLSGEGSS